MYSQKTNEQLVKLYQKKANKNIALEIIQRNIPLASKIYSELGLPECSRSDTLQEYCIMIIRILPTYKHRKGMFSTYLARCFRNMISSQLRCHQFFPESTISEVVLDTITDERFTPHAGEQDRIVNQVTEFLLSKLTTTERLLLKMRYGIGTNKHTLQMIAEQLKVSREYTRETINNIEMKIRCMPIARKLMSGIMNIKENEYGQDA